MEAKYQPGIFNVKNESDARAIILTPEGVTTDER